MFNSLWMYTMNCCRWLFVALLVSASVLAKAQPLMPEHLHENPAQALVPGLQKFPDNALRGKLKVLQAPMILMDGKPERLSPGARIRDTQQRLVMSASITHAELMVNFVRNSVGEVHEVWILTEAQAREKIKTNTPATHIRFASDADHQMQDDGKTPFHQLPSFEQLGKQQRPQQPKP
jgi:hypothetical protein